MIKRLTFVVCNTIQTLLDPNLTPLDLKIEKRWKSLNFGSVNSFKAYTCLKNVPDNHTFFHYFPKPRLCCVVEILLASTRFCVMPGGDQTLEPVKDIIFPTFWHELDPAVTLKCDQDQTWFLFKSLQTWKRRMFHRCSFKNVQEIDSFPFIPPWSTPLWNLTRVKQVLVMPGGHQTQ